MLQALWYMDAIHCLFLIRCKFLSIILFAHERSAEHLACDNHCEQHKKICPLGAYMQKAQTPTSKYGMCQKGTKPIHLCVCVCVSL